MASVKQRIEQIHQPRGGYLPLSLFKTTSLDDQRILHTNENIHSSLVGSTVDYLSRWGMGTPLTSAFQTSLLGAKAYDECCRRVLGACPAPEDTEFENAHLLLSGMKGLDNQSIANACMLAGYDVCYRTGNIRHFKPVGTIQPDNHTLDNIRIMVERSFAFWDTCGPILKSGFSFENGYTDFITAAEADYLTHDTLWDFKTTIGKPKPQDTLQLLIYYIMGCHSQPSEFSSIKTLGIFNPRTNTVYAADISSIPQTVIDEVSRDVIGYQ